MPGYGIIRKRHRERQRERERERGGDAAVRAHWNQDDPSVAAIHFNVGSQQRAGVVRLKYMSIDQIPSDLLTKPLTTEAHRRHTATLTGTRRPAWPEDGEQAKFLVEHSSNGVRMDTTILEGV